MKRLYSIILSLFVLNSLFSQEAPLQIQYSDGKLFVIHTVAAKENWYSIGRTYNISPKEIAPFNNTTLDKGLSIGQEVKIPLTGSNFLQWGQPNADEVVVPVYHQVKEKENLYRIGQQYNKVTVENLRTWNGLRSDEVSKDSPLIVGYLKVKRTLSPLAASGQSRTGSGAATAQVTKPVESKPAETKPSVPEEKKPEAAPQTTATAPPPAVKKTESVPVKNDEPVSTQPVPASNTSTSLDGGAFKSLFDEQTRSASDKENINGQVAVFKSTSGWKDYKYYALMNKVLPGTIIRVTNPQNNKYVYAKVLGEIPPGKENEGLSVRISNAAAAELALAETGRYELHLLWAKQ